MTLKYTGPGEDPGCSCHINPPCGRCEYMSEVDENEEEEKDVIVSSQWELRLAHYSAQLFVLKTERDFDNKVVNQKSILLDLNLERAYELHSALDKLIPVLEAMQGFPIVQKVAMQ